MLISSPCPLSHVLAYHNEQTWSVAKMILRNLDSLSTVEPGFWRWSFSRVFRFRSADGKLQRRT